MGAVLTGWGSKGSKKVSSCSTPKDRVAVGSCGGFGTYPLLLLRLSARSEAHCHCFAARLLRLNQGCCDVPKVVCSGGGGGGGV